MAKDEETERKEEEQHLREMLNILEHRRRLLELQKTKMGDRTPPDTHIALAETMRDIRLVQTKRAALRIDPKVMEAVGVEGLFLEISSKIDNLVSVTQTQNERLDTIETTVAEGSAWRAEQDAQRPARQEELDKRLSTQDTNIAELSRQVRWLAYFILAALIVGIPLYIFR